MNLISFFNFAFEFDYYYYYYYCFESIGSHVFILLKTGHGFSWTPLCMRWEDFSGWLLFIIMIAAICDVATAQIIEKSRI
jgi:hypothetical protein